MRPNSYVSFIELIPPKTALFISTVSDFISFIIYSLPTTENGVSTSVVYYIGRSQISMSYAGFEPTPQSSGNYESTALTTHPPGRTFPSHHMYKLSQKVECSELMKPNAPKE